MSGKLDNLQHMYNTIQQEWLPANVTRTDHSCFCIHLFHSFIHYTIRQPQNAMMKKHNTQTIQRTITKTYIRYTVYRT